MDINNFSSNKNSPEIIFAEVSDRLETVISHYRNIFISLENDIMRERLGAFCEELEDLRKKILDKTQPSAIRCESVDNIAVYMHDLIEDVNQAKNEAQISAHSMTGELVKGIDYIESMIGLGSQETDTVQEDILNDNSSASTMSYFKQKAIEIKSILSAST